jgi:hypothetical protein
MRAQEKLVELISLSNDRGISLKEGLRNDVETAAVLREEDYAFMDHPEKYTGLAESIVTDLLADLLRQRNLEPSEL